MTELATLLAEQRMLTKEEVIIRDMIFKVKTQLHSLQVEQLQLESIIREGESLKRKKQMNITGSPGIRSTDLSPIDMDSAETINKRELDLRVSKSLNEMVKGQFFADDQEEHESSSSEAEFILPC